MGGAKTSRAAYQRAFRAKKRAEALTKRGVADVELRSEGTGPDARRVILALGWEWSVWAIFGDGEARIRDVDVAARLGYDRPRKVRELIERIWPEGSRPNCRPAVGRQSTGNGASREYTVDEYWLTRAQVLRVVMRSTTPIADALQEEMARVLDLVLRAQEGMPLSRRGGRPRKTAEEILSGAPASPRPLPSSPAPAPALPAPRPPEDAARDLLAARLGVRFMPLPPTVDALLTTSGEILVRAAPSSTLVELETAALVALAHFGRAPFTALRFGDLHGWPRLCRVTREAFPRTSTASLAALSRWPVPGGVLPTPHLVSALAPAALAHTPVS